MTKSRGIYVPFMTKTIGIPFKLWGSLQYLSYSSISSKIRIIFQLSAHFELKITFLGIIFEPILGFFTSSIKHQTSSVQSLLIIILHIILTIVQPRLCQLAASQYYRVVLC